MRPMVTHTRQVDQPTHRHPVRSALAFFALWMLVGLSAQAVARPAMLALRGPWGGLLAGAVTGLLQWTLLGCAPLRRLPQDGAWWIIATSVALGLCSLLHHRLAPPYAALLMGGCLGMAQWLVLRRSARWSGSWVIMQIAIAWPAASTALAAVAWLTPGNQPLIAQILAGALQGAITGAATGLLLIFLLSGPEAQTDPTSAAEELSSHAHRHRAPGS